jgi:hypothetical protein
MLPAVHAAHSREQTSAIGLRSHVTTGFRAIRAMQDSVCFRRHESYHIYPLFRSRTADNEFGYLRPNLLTILGPKIAISQHVFTMA